MCHPIANHVRPQTTRKSRITIANRPAAVPHDPVHIVWMLLHKPAPPRRRHHRRGATDRIHHRAGPLELKPHPIAERVLRNPLVHQFRILLHHPIDDHFVTAPVQRIGQPHIANDGPLIGTTGKRQKCKNRSSHVERLSGTPPAEKSPRSISRAMPIHPFCGLMGLPV